MPGASLTRRERRFVLVGGIISGLALILVFFILPFSRRWNEREDLIALGADRVAKLHALINNEARLRSEVELRETAGGRGQLVSGRTPALAASALQTTIQGYAAQSRITVSRLDLAGEPDSSAAPLASIPASVLAVGDIYGISEFLTLIQRGTPVIEVKELTMVSSSALRGGLIQLSLGLRAPTVIQ